MNNTILARPSGDFIVTHKEELPPGAYSAILDGENAIVLWPPQYYGAIVNAKVVGLVK